MLERMGGRKLAVSLIALITGLGVSLGMGDIPDNLLQLLEVIVASFVSGNIAAQVFGAIKPVKKIKPDPDDEGSSPIQQEVQVAPVAPTQTVSEGVPVQVAVDAFRELGALIDGHSRRTQQTLDELAKATQINQQALSVIVDKVMSRG